MTTMTSPHDAWRAFRLAMIAVLLATGAASAATPAERFCLRVFGVGLSVTGDEIRLADAAAADGARFSLADGSAVGFELEYLWRPRIAVELMAHFGDYDAGLEPAAGAAGLASRGSLGSETYTLGVNYRAVTRGRLELSLGAFGGFSYYDDVTLAHPATGRPEVFRFDDDLGFGAKLGLDVALDAERRWLAGLVVRYQSSILEGEVAGRDMDVDPLSLALGVGYRF